MRDREGLVARIRQMRRVPAQPDARAPRPQADPAQDEPSMLEARVAHLEQLVQGLQDSVHRETMRLTKRVTELEASIQPATLSKALSEDARERGL